MDSGQRKRRIERALPRLLALENSLKAGRTTSEGARTILDALGIAIPKAKLTALPENTPKPPEKARNAETTLF